MAVIFNQLCRGLWKNQVSPVLRKKYINATSTPSAASTELFQPYKRESSEISGQYYEYDRAVSKSNLIGFGEDGLMTSDLYGYAHMPFKGYSSTSFKKYDLEVSQYNSDDNKIWAWNSYGSKWTSYSGIFFSSTKINEDPITSGTHINECKWYGLSVAGKGDVPTLKCFDKSTLAGKSGRICTSNISFFPDSKTTLTIYQNRVKHGSYVTYFDADDHNIKIKYVYITIQAPGGNGGNNVEESLIGRRNGGAGGGAGGYGVYLCKIPDDGYLKITIPKKPEISSENDPTGERRSDSIIVKNNDNIELIEVTGGQWGYYYSEDDEYFHANGEGGIASPSYSINVKSNNYCECLISIKGIDGGKQEESSDPTQSIAISKVLSTDENIILPKVGGVPNAQDEFNSAYLRLTKEDGPGGSSYFGLGGKTIQNNNGNDGEGPGAGGSGAGRPISSGILVRHFGGAGGKAFVNIGY